jgi:tripartite-type tricarboxylate transporter receptor subunit TctC
MRAYTKSVARCFAAAPLLLAAMTAGVARADTYPDKPIRLIVPYPPGGSNDVLGRYFGIKLTERLGQHVVIDNRGGANGIIGTELAAQSPPDGYTLLMLSASFTMNAAARKSLPYDIKKDFAPITTVATSSNSIIVDPKWGVKNVKELIARAKAKPGSISYASTGVNSFNHFGGELFKTQTGVKMVHVPYKGGGPAMLAVMSSQIPVMFSSITQALPHVRSGKLQMIAVGAPKRSPSVPDVPTMIESGYPDYLMPIWWGVTAVAGTPPEIVTKLYETLAEEVKDPATIKRLLIDAAEPHAIPPAEFRQLIDAELIKWKKVAQVAGIKPQ